MKRFVVLGGIICGVGVILIATRLLDHVTNFVIAGQLPFSSISIPPVAMLLFWLLVVPIVVISRYMVREGFWKTVEVVGDISQRHINRTVRWTVRSGSLLPLGAITLLYIAEQLEDDAAVPIGALFSRRALSTAT